MMYLNMLNIIVGIYVIVCLLRQRIHIGIKKNILAHIIIPYETHMHNDLQLDYSKKTTMFIDMSVYDTWAALDWVCKSRMPSNQ